MHEPLTWFARLRLRAFCTESVFERCPGWSPTPDCSSGRVQKSLKGRPLARFEPSTHCTSLARKVRNAYSVARHPFDKVFLRLVVPSRIGATAMIRRPRRLVFLAPLGLLGFLGFAMLAQQGSPGGQYPNSLLSGLHWRDVGPMRGGRTFAVAGHASQPDTFYFGSVGGGVWKTENAGHTWVPISDEGIPIGSIGAIAVAPSNANVVYVGTGESDIRSQHSYGTGMYKSLDAGKTWTHIGLEATRQIGRVVVDPANANRVYVAALGHVYDANPDRGVYRSMDGGAAWKKVLFKTNDPDNVGAVDVAIDPKNPRVLYASLWATRRPPWSVYAPTNLPGGGLYKSTDGGDTWKQLTGGLPNDEFVGKIGIAVSPSNPDRLWAVVDDLGSGIARGAGGGGRGAA